MLRSKKANLGAIMLAVVCLALATLACNRGGTTVTIVSPASGATVSVGEVVQITSRADADAGVARVDLSAGGVFVAATAPPGGTTPPEFLVEQQWTPMATGQVTISVVAYDANGDTQNAKAQMQRAGDLGFIEEDVFAPELYAYQELRDRLRGNPSSE